jgi:predicted nucleotidyltransferase
MKRESPTDLAATVRQLLEHWHGSGVLAAYLYGSILTERSRDDSDIDVAVLDVSDRRLGWAEQSRLMDEMERALGEPVDLRMLRDCSASHQAHVLERGLLVWTDDPARVEAYTRRIQTRYAARTPSIRRELASQLRALESRATLHDESRISR